MNCNKCNAELAKEDNIRFGDAEYEQWKCPVCNTVEYKAVGVLERPV